MTNSLKALRNWIESNPNTVADWVVDMAYDERPQPRGPLFGGVICEDFAEKFCMQQGENWRARWAQ